MTAPTKDNEHIRADQQAFMEAYARARKALGQLPGVVGVGFGHKQVAGKFSPDVVITVFVREKKKESELDPSQRIPASFEGYRTDVRLPFSAAIGACDNTGTYSTIQGGIQVQAMPSTPPPGIHYLGTLGCIVRKRGDSGRENVYLISNKHVLFANGAGKNDNAYHPEAPPGVGTQLGPVQAGIYDNVSSRVPSAAAGGWDTDTFFIDCAFARIDIDSTCLGSTCTKDVIAYATSVVDLNLNGVNTFSDVRSVARDPSIVLPSGDPDGTTPRVFKVGRTTGKTAGIVRGVNSTSNLPADPSIPGAQPVAGLNVIEIEFDKTSETTQLNCKGHAWFGEHGDSGSIVVDHANRVIGILGGVPDSDNPNTAADAPCGAYHIIPVLDALKICIPTVGGTSYGSCAAVDGSGLKSVPPARTAAPTGAPVFQGHSALAEPVVRADSFVPFAVSDAERDRMLVFRDALRETPAGRTLHDDFAQMRREIGYLIRNSRPVKVVWQRTQGPAYFASMLNHLRGDTPSLPREIGGIRREDFLVRMGDVLAAHGSNSLRAAIERYRIELLPALVSATDALDCLRLFEGRESRTRSS